MEGNGHIAGFICVGTFIAVVEYRGLLQAGEYLTFIGTALGAAFLVGLFFSIGTAAYTTWFQFYKKEETLFNCVLFWVMFLTILGAITWVGFR